MATLQNAWGSKSLDIGFLGQVIIGLGRTRQLLTTLALQLLDQVFAQKALSAGDENSLRLEIHDAYLTSRENPVHRKCQTNDTNE